MICALVMLRFMPKTDTHQRKFDMFGFALLAIAPAPVRGAISSSCAAGAPLSVGCWIAWSTRNNVYVLPSRRRIIRA